MNNSQTAEIPAFASDAHLLRGKVAVITGVATGIGRATALLFAQQGARVFCCDIQDPQGRETVQRIQSSGGIATYHHADVTSAEDLDAFAAQCAREVDHVDILFNNAGALLRERMQTTTDEGWDAMLATNLSSVFRCSRRFLPLLTRSRAGAIVNHASVDASLGNPSLAAYSAAKGGLIPLTHVMAHDLAQYGIRVNAISSGGIDTGMSASPAAAARREAVTPLARSGRPEEVAQVALFLASEWSSFVNGANLVVDGGRTGITPGCF